MSGCREERAVLDALRSGRLDPELRRHAEECGDCRDLALVGGLLLEERAALQQSDLPTSGAMWWRIERRARQEAATRARRSVTAVQVAAVVLGLVVAMAIGGIGWASEIALPAVPPVARWGAMMLLGVVAWTVLAPVAIYFAVTDE